MIIPLDLLIRNKDNMYSLANAAIKRADQIHLVGDEELEQNKGKIVSTAISQVLRKKVQYRLEG